MKKALAMILAVVMCLSLFAACGKKEDPKATTTAGSNADTTTVAPTTEAPKPTTLNVVTEFGGGDQHEAVYKEINDKFAADTGNTINDNSGSANEEWKASVVADFNADNAPDVMFFFNGTTLEPIVKTGQLISVADIQAVDAEYGKNIDDSILNGTGNTSSDGKVYGLPLKGFAETLFVNKKIFEDNGVALPDSWDNLIAACKALSDKGITPFATALGVEPHYFFDHLIMSAGGCDALSKVPASADEAPAAWAEGIALLKDLYDAKAFPADTATMTGGQDIQAYFASGKAAMYLDGSWAIGSVPTEPKEGMITQDDVIMMAFPAKNAQYQGNVITGYSSAWYITKKAWDDPDKRAAAIAYVKAQTSDEAIAKYCSPELGGFTSSKGANALIDASKRSPLINSTAEVVAAATAQCGPLQDLLKQGTREWAFANMIKVATGDMTAEDFVKQLIETENA